MQAFFNIANGLTISKRCTLGKTRSWIACTRDPERHGAELMELHMHALKTLTAELLEQETVDGARVEELVHPALRRAA